MVKKLLYTTIIKNKHVNCQLAATSQNDNYILYVNVYSMYASEVPN